MKKRIALLMILCLILSGCQNPVQTPEHTGATENISKSTLATSIQETAGTKETTQPIVWKSHQVSTAFRNFHAEGTTLIYRLTYELWTGWAKEMLQRHKECLDTGSCVWQQNEKCEIVELFNSPKYSEEYFTKNTLVAVDVLDAYGKPHTIKGLTYDNNILTFTIERPKYEYEWYKECCILLEIESVLPTNTELKFVIEEYELPKVPEGLPKNIDFKWQHTTVSSDLFFRPSVGEKYKDVISGQKYPGTMHRFAGYAGMLISDYESYEEIKAEDALINGNYTDWPTYDKAYFADKCIVLFNITASVKYRGLKDVRYQDGILTCSILCEPTRPDEVVNTGPVLRYLYIIEVDTKLPEGMVMEPETVYTES